MGAIIACSASPLPGDGTAGGRRLVDPAIDASEQFTNGQQKGGYHMRVVLITGVTGFLGSAVAAALLARGLSVVAVSRNDPDGLRTETSILDAAVGFGLEIMQPMRERLTVVDARDASLAEALDAVSLRDIEAVWHCAAEMSYSSRKLLQAFHMNACNNFLLE